MGSTIVRLVHQSGTMKVAGAIEGSAHPQLNKDAGEVAGVGQIGVPIATDLMPLLNGQVIIIEFTAPDATLEHAKLAAEKKVPIVIGTTGLDQRRWPKSNSSRAGRRSCFQPI
jgi:4-hydroxy-tetrahydrodipicolinate reductase